jgi:hypothetical protein
MRITDAEFERGIRLWMVTWYNDEIEFLKGTCLADALKRGGKYASHAVKDFRVVQ